MSGYIIVYRDSTVDLAREVNNFARSGFVPCGSLVKNEVTNNWMQPMWKPCEVAPRLHTKDEVIYHKGNYRAYLEE